MIASRIITKETTVLGRSGFQKNEPPKKVAVEKRSEESDDDGLEIETDGLK
jgi:hypothetical protein